MSVKIIFALAMVLLAMSANCQTTADYEKALVHSGNNYRLNRVFARAERGESITVAVIGGSITQGAMASSPDKTYGGLMAKWWREQFPKAKVTFVNAGIGATGSLYGTLRAERDLLAKKPDFVVVEYAVNDAPDEFSAKSYEGLLRKILKQPRKPAVLLLFMMNEVGGNAQEWQTKVGNHYDLAMISYRDAIWSHMQAGDLKWTDISPDVVHPNDRGHAFAAGLIVQYLENALKEASSQTEARLPRTPEPLLTGEYEHTEFNDGTDLKLDTNEGWTYNDQGRYWQATKPGSVLTFSLNGRNLFLTFFRIKGPMGHVKAQVDDGPPVILEGWFDQTWGGYWPTETLALGLKPGKHEVKITLLEEKNAGSTGNEFHIQGAGSSGL